VNKINITLDNWKSADLRSFEHKKSKIHDALSGSTGIIDGVTEEHKEDIFYMLLFCLCVPQSRAVSAEESIKILYQKNYYQEDLVESVVQEALKGKVRFQSIKTQRIINARSQFFNSELWESLKNYYKEYNINTTEEDRFKLLYSARKYLMQFVSGLGPKTSSHFLRNIGMSGLCILDVHVIEGLYKRGVINKKRLGPSQSEYIKTEEKMKNYAKSIGLSIDELDLLLWSQKTGYVFK